MPTFTDTDLRAMVDRVQQPVLADELNEAIGALKEADSRIQSATYRLGLLVSGPNPLPAPDLTEAAIVAALKADPGMAAEVLVTLGFTMDRTWRMVVRDRAQFCCQHAARPELLSGLQSLAVALAAASYRG